MGHAGGRCQLRVNTERACALEAEENSEVLPAALAVPTGGTMVSNSMASAAVCRIRESENEAGERTIRRTHRDRSSRPRVRLRHEQLAMRAAEVFHRPD